MDGNNRSLNDETNEKITSHQSSNLEKKDTQWFPNSQTLPKVLRVSDRKVTLRILCLSLVGVLDV